MPEGWRGCSAGAEAAGARSPARRRQLGRDTHLRPPARARAASRAPGWRRGAGVQACSSSSRLGTARIMRRRTSSPGRHRPSGLHPNLKDRPVRPRRTRAHPRAISVRHPRARRHHAARRDHLCSRRRCACACACASRAVCNDVCRSAAKESARAGGRRSRRASGGWVVWWRARAAAWRRRRRRRSRLAARRGRPRRGSLAAAGAPRPLRLPRRPQRRWTRAWRGRSRDRWSRRRWRRRGRRRASGARRARTPSPCIEAEAEAAPRTGRTTSEPHPAQRTRAQGARPQRLMARPP